MEILYDFLDVTFSKFPINNETKQAKDEIWEIMEDKFQELIDEGKTQDEAIGIVLSEFGNIDELKETLGIKENVKESTTSNNRVLTLEDTKKIISERIFFGYLVSLGIWLTIFAVSGAIFFLEIRSKKMEVVGGVFLITFISVAVGLFIYLNIRKKKWKELFNICKCIETSTVQYIQNHKEKFQSKKKLLIVIGVILCVLGIVQPIIFDGFNSSSSMSLEAISAILMLIFVGVGILLFVIINIRNKTYDSLLSFYNIDDITIECNSEK